MKSYVLHLFLCLVSGLAILPSVQAQLVSRSFELRYFSDSTQALGDNDFRGDSSIFSTQQRIEYLTNYANYAKQFFENPDLDQKAVVDETVSGQLSKIKPQPFPRIRQRLELDNWLWHIGRPQQHETDLTGIEEWIETGDVALVDGKLYAMSEYAFAKPIEEQSWRFSLEWQVRVPQTEERSAFVLLDENSNPIVLLGITAEGGCFYKSSLGLPINCGQFENDTLLHFKLDVDVESGRFSMYLNGERKANFVKALAVGNISKFFIKLPKGATLDDLHAISYSPPRRDEGQFATEGHVFLDQDFEVPPDLDGWMKAGYQDGRWESINLPLTSGEWFRESDLYLRKEVSVGDFQRAVFHSEYLSTNSEIWLNGKVIHVQTEAGPLNLNISRYLERNTRNFLALRLRAGDGWSIGKSWLDLTNKTYIQDVFAYAESVGDTAQLRLRTELKSEDAQQGSGGFWQGQVKVNVYQWAPFENTTPVLTQQFPVSLRLYRDELLDWSLAIRRPQLWSPDDPNLYKISIALTDAQGNAVDDYVITTGLRTVSQRGGTLHLNNEPFMLSGGNLSNYPPEPENRPENPADNMKEWLVRAVQMVKNLNGNSLRTEVLPNRNPAVLAQLCDQLGIVLIQQTNTPTAGEVEPWEKPLPEVTAYVEQLRNHPSILLWQAADQLTFTDFQSDGLFWMEQYYRSVFNNDPSRLISLTGVQPAFGNADLPNDMGTMLYNSNRRSYTYARPSLVWTANKVVRGNAEKALGTGADWASLRRFPFSEQTDTLRFNYLRSPQRAYFDFEGETVTGRANPYFIKGSLYYPSQFFQDATTTFAIGKELEEEQWAESQAWQAFSLYEALRKKRWLGYDGLYLSAIWNGGDPAAVVDGAGYAKMAYYTARMAFQKVLAGSRNTDLVYGTGEQIPIFVSHWGEAKRVEVQVTIKDVRGNVVKTMRFPSNRLQAMNRAIPIGVWTNTISKSGWYIIEYEVTQEQV